MRDAQGHQIEFDYGARGYKKFADLCFPFFIAPAFPVCHKFGSSRLFDDKSIAILRLLVDVGRIDMQLARQNQVIEKN